MYQSIWVYKPGFVTSLSVHHQPAIKTTRVNWEHELVFIQQHQENQVLPGELTARRTLDQTIKICFSPQQFLDNLRYRWAHPSKFNRWPSHFTFLQMQFRTLSETNDKSIERTRKFALWTELLLLLN